MLLYRSLFLFIATAVSGTILAKCCWLPLST
nr:MAG TPA: hypothetical protein [Caudoviricetes sp.]